MALGHWLKDYIGPSSANSGGGTVEVREISKRFSIMPMSGNNTVQKVVQFNEIDGYEALTASNIVSYDVTLLPDTTNHDVHIVDKYMNIYAVDGELSPRSSTIVLWVNNPTSETLTVYYTVKVRYLVTA